MSKWVAKVVEDGYLGATVNSIVRINELDIIRRYLFTGKLIKYKPLRNIKIWAVESKQKRNIFVQKKKQGRYKLFKCIFLFLSLSIISAASSPDSTRTT